MPQAVARLGGAPIFLGVLAVAAAVGIGYMIYKEYKSNRSSPSEAHRMRQLGAPHSIRNERTTREKSEKDQISGEFESSKISISKPAVFPVGPKAIPSDNTSHEASREELKEKRPQEARVQVASHASPRKASAANVDAVQDALPIPPPYSESVQTQAPSSLGLPSLIARNIQTPAGGEHELEHANDFVIVRHDSTSESSRNDDEQSLFDESESVTEIPDVENRKITREGSTGTMSTLEAAIPTPPVLLSDDVHSELKSQVNSVDTQKPLRSPPRIQLPTPPPETLELSSPSTSLPPPITLGTLSLLQAPPLLERSISNSTMQSFRTAQSSASESSGDTDFYSLPPSMPETPTAGATYSPVGDGEHLSDDEMLAKLDSALGLVGTRHGDGLT
ncbi:hypothetical protein SCHPADRAFT_946522 [Schizopora paradoxa]|uniref:Uncharacterized protein n=1 Tax=Schizopora paradoxa TaxID=27342 RepID=A0A0H2R2B8_9AGAM|nr:hypothetical protein SCHPADRAFT_946522 [Schizopora paradoxa]